MLQKLILVKWTKQCKFLSKRLRESRLQATSGCQFHATTWGEISLLLPEIGVATNRQSVTERATNLGDLGILHGLTDGTETSCMVGRRKVISIY